MLTNWSQIPPHILLCIFKQLSDTDLGHSSCTCKSWNYIAQSACLWRKRTFKFRGHATAHRKRSIFHCMRLTGHHMRELCLEYPMPNLLTARSISTCTYTLFTELTLALWRKRSALQSFTLKDLAFDETWNGFQMSKNILVYSLGWFLVKQGKLKSLDMSKASVPDPFASRLFKALLNSKSMRSLERLRLDDFFSPSVDERKSILNTHILFSSLKWLKHISISISCLDDKNLLCLCSKLGPTLEQLDLHVACYERYPFSDNIWHGVRSRCPRLKVTMNFDFWPLEPTQFIKPEIPIAALSIKGFLCRLKRMYAKDIGQFLWYLADNVSASLDSISLLLTFSHEPACSVIGVDEVIRVWLKCPVLKTANFSRNILCSRLSSDCDLNATIRLDDTRVIRVNKVTDKFESPCFRFSICQA